MTTTLTDYKYIQLSNQGVPIISGSTIKVIDLVMAQMAYGWTPEEIHINHRDLSMSQIHSALAYYWDHKEELDNYIQDDLEFAQKMREKAGESPFVTRLKAQGIKTNLPHQIANSPTTQTLDQRLKGKVGRVNFKPSDLSERVEEAFTELLEGNQAFEITP